MTERNRTAFLFKNLGRGILWLLAIVAVFVLLKDSEFIQDQAWLQSISENYLLVFIVFLVSEVVFGIIPPELFMIWSISHGVTPYFGTDILVLASISYGAGVLGYYIGVQFSHTRVFMKLYNRYLQQYEDVMKRFSGFILFVAAVTPVPYSAMCMLVGTINYSRKYFYLITLSRFVRFFVYGYLIYSANYI